jgi:predicted AlkP superfamily phosphohydrolase/phosphomutase
MLTVAISGLPNRILQFMVWRGCEPCCTVEGGKSNKNGRRHMADYCYSTVRSPTKNQYVTLKDKILHQKDIVELIKIDYSIREEDQTIIVRQWSNSRGMQEICQVYDLGLFV